MTELEVEFYENLRKVKEVVKIRNKAKFNTTKTILVCRDALMTVIKLLESKEKVHSHDIYIILYVSKKVEKLIPTVSAFTRKTSAMFELTYFLNIIEKMGITDKNILSSRRS